MLKLTAKIISWLSPTTAPATQSLEYGEVEIGIDLTEFDVPTREYEVASLEELLQDSLDLDF